MTNKICKISLFSAILACVASVPVDAAVNVKSSRKNYAEAYNRVNALQYQQDYLNTMMPNVTTASATANLPVAVDDEKLANAILNNDADAPSVSELDACSMIYPNSVFRWGLPTSGVRKNQTPQCIAVVNLVDANSKAILATTTVAAGDLMKCNIDMFPESGMNASNLSKVELPADNPPTMEEVEAVMNEEQRQHAGLKIATAAIISGVAGNILAPKTTGNNNSDSGKLFGTSNTQLQDTAIGAVAGAGIMAASTYSGKVAGDTIKSTAVNAASGMVLGNMLAGTSDSEKVLNITKCKLEDGSEKDCIVGALTITKKNATTIKSGTGENENNKIYIVRRNSFTILGCHKDNTITTDENKFVCQPESDRFTEIYVSINNTSKLLKDLKNGDIIHGDVFTQTTDNPNLYEKVSYTNNADFDSVYYIVSRASKVEGAARPAYAVFSNPLAMKPLGYKVADWDNNLKSRADIKYYYRNYDGSLGAEITTDENQTIIFDEASLSASDGSLVDLSNEARAKGTIIGTAAGGAMGGFAGYQGAKTEIQERWTSATLEYKDSLSNFVCVSGGRFLAKYNDYVEIPSLTIPEE